MSWSITIFRVAGTEIRIHLTFFLLLAWFAVSGYQIAEWRGALESVLMIVAIFGCVVLHELGHVFAARRYGITTPHITLLPIGGLAQLSRMPEKPGEEVVIAIAGPLVNVAIAGLLLLLGADLSLDPERIVTYGDAFISQLAVINLYLFAFNLIPAFPMDGGRVLRALLAFRLGRGRATRIAARIGQGVAIIFALLGLLWGNILLLLIAGFVFLAASSESGATGLMEVARRISLERAMVRAFETLSPQATIGGAADALLRTTQAEFPVVDGGGRMRGVLTRNGIVSALRSDGPNYPVIEAMERAPVVPLTTPLIVAARLIAERGAPMVGVADADGRLVGYVSRDNLSELMMMGDSLGEKPRAAGPWGQADSTGREA